MDAVKEFSRLSRCYFAGGGFRESSSGTVLPVIDPATAQPLGEIAECTAAEIDEVVALAGEAQRAWRRESALERAE